MPYSPELHHRRSIRLKGYDYSQAGAYFITIVTQGWECVFGEVVGDDLRLNANGEITRQVREDLPTHYARMELGEFMIMPNHIHAIIVLTDVYGAGSGANGDGTPKRYPLSEIVRGFKTFSARRINERRNMPGMPVWQRNYYEHIIRDENEMNRIRAYIWDNPRRWAEDHENPSPLKLV
ncbi:MAG: transposase [Anaerolineaceae bacterium]|nr:transposase [Anaerolineaceae bacterium]